MYLFHFLFVVSRVINDGVKTCFDPLLIGRALLGKKEKERKKGKKSEKKPE